MDQTITWEQLDAYERAFDADRAKQVAMHAVTSCGVVKAAVNPEVFREDRHQYSISLEQGKITNQKQSGRCWMFAALNTMRFAIMKKLDLATFELSQNYTLFYDKLEKANYFLESILATLDEPTNGRVIAHLLMAPLNDGGQWDMFCSLIEKYGVVPKDAMTETYQSGHTHMISHLLNQSLKKGALALREMAQAGEGEDALQQKKNQLLGQAYSFLCSCYGEPPKTFDFEYVDKDKVYHCQRNLTPRAFFQQYIGSLERYVSIINAPTADKPYNKTYTVQYLGNVVGGRQVKYLNLPMQELKEAVIAQLKDGQVVWFGSDVGKFGQRELGIWDDKSFDYELATGLDIQLTKEQRLDSWDSCMTHAMVITGVNLDENGKPNRWRIENSWGDDKGDKGYYVCSDSWFDLLVYQAVIDKKYLGEKAALLDQEPVLLKPWDPMGALAR